jgi:hypothetical protein
VFAHAQNKHSVQINAGYPLVESIVPSSYGYSLALSYKYNITSGLAIRPYFSINSASGKAKEDSVPLSYTNKYWQVGAQALLDMEPLVQLHTLTHKLNLYLLLGTGYMGSHAQPYINEKYLSESGIKVKELSQVIYYFSLGSELHYYINPMIDAVLGLDVNMTSSRYLAGYEKPLGTGYYNNNSITNFYVGVKYKFSSIKNKKQCYDWKPKEEAKAAITPELLFTDSDHDGVPDLMDQDKQTPFGIRVDTKGVPLDTDYDGIPDYKDKCPTVKGNKSKEGCPDDSMNVFKQTLKDEFFKDSDNDGVVDAVDQDNNTPAGVKVDTKGVELDSDGDTIPDSKDNCPFVVGLPEKNGCPQ